MLTTLIYQSKIKNVLNFDSLDKLILLSTENNTKLFITGVLIFNGDYFFQVLEGEEDTVSVLFNKIKIDARHENVVEIMRDYSSHRRFKDIGMRLFDLRKENNSDINEMIIRQSQSSIGQAQQERMFRLINNFIERSGTFFLPLGFKKEKCGLVSRLHSSENTWPKISDIQECQFALQPIVEPLKSRISSYEALIRGLSGESPQMILSSIPEDEIYIFDLASKMHALNLGKCILKQDEKISINLLPGTLLNIPNAVPTLIGKIHNSGLSPQQVIIEITESEIISGNEGFQRVVKELRGAGIGIAIDDFGAGYSGLSLLTILQPDKIKIDRLLIQNIHSNGPKQAIVSSIVRCCHDLGISIVAEGVESLDEWHWLQSVGINLFQGFLFSRPCIDGRFIINWPEIDCIKKFHN